MKSVRSLALVLAVAAVAALNVARAQPASTESLDATWRAALEVITAKAPLPAHLVPRFGSFYSAQFGAKQPPLPWNALNLSAWPLGDGLFILDDRDLDYAKLRAEAEAEALLSAEMNAPSSMMRSSLLNSSYAYARPVYLTNIAVSSSGTQAMTASFSIAGGTNFVPYDILRSTNVTNSVSQWTWLGIGYTSNRYTFSNQPMGQAFYILARPQKTMTVGWGNDAVGQCAVPSGVTNALMVAGGGGQSLVLLSNGKVVAWGQSSYGQGSVPTNLAGVSMIACGWYHNVALLTNGSVTAWGLNSPSLGWYLTNVPTALTNATVISAQALHTLALTSNGTVMAWGYGPDGQTNVPSGLSNVVAIAAGYRHSLAVKADGTVVAWGFNGFGQCTIPFGLSNVVDVAAGLGHSVALRSDGTLAAWGDTSHGETSIPSGLSNVVAIAAGGDPTTNSSYTLALKSDGTAVKWGGGEVLGTVTGLSNVIAIASGADHALALRTGPRTPVITLHPVDTYQIAGGSVTFQARGAGLYGMAYQWQSNGVNLLAATNATLTLTNVQAALENVAYRVAVSNEVGSIISTNAYFHLVTAPIIVTQTPLPTNQAVVLAGNLTLSVTASAPGQFNGFPLGYQWKLNGTNISGAISNSFTISSLTTSTGLYTVVVSNVTGSANASWNVTINYGGSLVYHLATNAVGRAAGRSGTSNDMMLVSGWTYAQYSSTNFNMHLLTNSVWSTNCWLKGVKGLSATAIGISNGYGGATLLTMISPRHYLRATHVDLDLPPGMIAFLDTNNMFHWRTTVDEVTIGDDTDVGFLDADLPTSVGFLPVLPTNYSTYLPTNSAIDLQGIGMNQDMKVFSQPIKFTHIVSWNPTVQPLFGLATNWNIAVRSGDSSDPERLLIGDQLVLISHHTTPTSGPNLSSQFNSINQVMHYLSTNYNAGSDYQLSPITLTNWISLQ